MIATTPSKNALATAPCGIDSLQHRRTEKYTDARTTKEEAKMEPAGRHSGNIARKRRRPNNDVDGDEGETKDMPRQTARRPQQTGDHETTLPVFLPHLSHRTTRSIFSDNQFQQFSQDGRFIQLMIQLRNPYSLVNSRILPQLTN
jgi:chromatin remodeling complex protein RSC6